MAIYSLNIRSIGKTTQKAPYTAAAALRYISRKTACEAVLSQHCPLGEPGNTRAAEAWLRLEENGDRKNARIADRIIVALPRELSSGQQADAITTFMRRLCKDRTPWIAGLHNGLKNASNPHAHILVRDRDIETDKRVIGLSEKGAVDQVRALWESVCNSALKAARSSERIDHRSNAKRGLKQIPGIHVGQRLIYMAAIPDGETRMKLNEKIKAANAALDEVNALRAKAANDNDLMLAIAQLLSEERAETKRKLRLEQERRMEIETSYSALRSEMQKMVNEARDMIRALVTRIMPVVRRPTWLSGREWAAYVGIMRFSASSGGFERSERDDRRSVR